MRNSIRALCFGLTLLSANAFSHDHVTHGMVLFGDGPVFASHIVYKTPHNFQLILEVRFDHETQSKYLTAKQEHPGRNLILLLENIDIKEIAFRPDLVGKIIYEDTVGDGHTIAEGVTLHHCDFDILYLDELPDFSAPMPMIALGSSHLAGSCGCIKRPVMKCELGEAYQCTCDDGSRYTKCQTESLF